MLDGVDPCHDCRQGTTGEVSGLALACLCLLPPRIRALATAHRSPVTGHRSPFPMTRIAITGYRQHQRARRRRRGVRRRAARGALRHRRADAASDRGLPHRRAPPRCVRRQVPAAVAPAGTRAASAHTARLALVAAAEAWRTAGLGDGARRAAWCSARPPAAWPAARRATGSECIGDAERGALACWLETPVAVATDAGRGADRQPRPAAHRVDRVLVRRQRARHRRRLDPRRPRHGRALRRRRLALPHDVLGLQRAAGARPRALPAVRSRARRAHRWAKARRCSCSRTGRRRGRAARASSASCSATASAPTPTTSPSRAPTAPARCWPCGARSRTPGVGAEAIDYVNAHGTGTPLNDAVETRAIKAVLGARAYAVPVSSTKSRSATASPPPGRSRRWRALLALRGGFVPPTATLVEPDPECDLDYVPRVSRPAALRTVLSNSYGFGGNNTSVVLRAARSRRDARA